MFPLSFEQTSRKNTKHLELDVDDRQYDRTVFFGLMFVSMIQGMPLGEDGNMTATFTDYVNPFSIVGGIALTLLCYLHGLNYIALKTEGPIRARARNYASIFMASYMQA